MAYQALYRKWRPLTFNQVIGQQHIVNTLKHQIETDNVAHAYLFTGTRGTGKTTMARILSRAVNCLQPQNGEPCNECEICRGILDESILDVIEMDAASNNSVEDIRDLKENVKYPPSKAKKKVYIIDEVHMLSQGAFNALLKTLEEPPEYVLFVLATTEPHKIPTTILSRCQRFNVKRVTETDVFDLLTKITESYNINASDEALQLIIRRSDGAVRDSMSALDQCINTQIDALNVSDVQEALGLVDIADTMEIINAIGSVDGSTVLRKIKLIVEEGKDVSQFTGQLLSCYRDIMVTKMSNGHNEDFVQGNEHYYKLLKDTAEKLSMTMIMRGMETFTELSSSIKFSSQPRFVLETNLIRLMQPQFDESIESLVQRIEMLEKRPVGVASPVNNQPIVEQNESSDDDTIESKTTESTSVEIDDDDKFEGDLSPGNFKDQWSKLMRIIKNDSASIHALLDQANDVRLNGKRIVVSFNEGNQFFVMSLKASSNVEYMESVIQQFFGQPLKIDYEEINQSGVDDEVSLFFKGFEDVTKITD